MIRKTRWGAGGTLLAAVAIALPAGALGAETTAGSGPNDPAGIFQTLCVAHDARIDAVVAAARQIGFTPTPIRPKVPEDMEKFAAMERGTGANKLALLVSAGTSAVDKDLPDRLPVRACAITGGAWDAWGFARAWVGLAPLVEDESIAIYSYFQRPGGNIVADRDRPEWIAGLNAGELRTLAVTGRDGMAGVSWVIFDPPATPIRAPDPGAMARTHETQPFAPCKWESKGRGKAATHRLMCPSETGAFLPEPAKGVTEATPDAARDGDISAMLKLASFYAHGPKPILDPTTAAIWSRKAADAGAAAGAFNLGLAYQAGYGVPKDQTEAERWYRTAADRQFVPAMINLAGLLLDRAAANDDGTERAAALALVRSAAEGGSSAAQFDMGYLSENGLGTAKDMTEALRWYRQAADQKDLDAMLRIGLIHADGIGGVERDEAEGLRWLVAGTKPILRIAESVSTIDTLVYGFDDSRLRAAHMAAAATDPATALRLGMYFAQPTSRTRDSAEAMRFFRIAATANIPLAILEMGVRQAEGEGVARNEAEALQWLRKDNRLRAIGAFRRIRQFSDSPAS